MVSLKSVFLILITAFIVVACSDSQNQARSDHDLATELISQGDYSAAIQVMSGRLSTDPSDQKARILMAAGFAGRAGIFMNKFIRLAQELKTTSGQISKFFDEGGLFTLSNLRKKANGREKSVLETLEKTYKALFQLEAILSAFETLPDISTLQQQNDLNSAISVLEGDSQLSGGNLLYRGLLRIVRFKYDLKTKYQMDIISDDCSIGITRLRDYVQDLHYELREILKDIVGGTTKPEDRGSLQRELDNLDKTFQEVYYHISGLPNTQELSVKSLMGDRCDS